LRARGRGRVLNAADVSVVLPVRDRSEPSPEDDNEGHDRGPGGGGDEGGDAELERDVDDNQLDAAIWMRLPQVSSSTAVVTGPIAVGS
jgi:hypothetical protein